MNQTRIPIAAIRAREADPLTRIAAQQRADRFTDALRPHEKRIASQVAQAVRANSPVTKVALLRAVTDLIAHAARGNVACSKGCSACCHIAVLVSPPEAAVIGSEIGVQAAFIARGWRPDQGDAMADRHYGVPCPFLKDNACSIYASRPLACRTQYNVDADALLCTVAPDEAPITVPYWNHQWLTTQISHAFAASMFGFADIRDFFPKGKGRA